MNKQQAKHSNKKPTKVEATVKKPKKNMKSRRVKSPIDITKNVVAGQYSTSKGANTSTDNVSSVATAVVEVKCVLDNSAISACSRAFVNYALSKGWNSNAQTANPEWFYALVQLNYIFSAYCTGTVSDSMMELPACVVKLGNLLKPKKNLPYYGGRLSLTWDKVEAEVGFQFTEGPSNNSVVSQYGVYTGNEPTTDYPFVGAPGPLPTDPTILTAALQSMFAYCQNLSGNAKFWQNVAANKEYNNWANDPSAFAVVLPIDGNVRNGSGAFATIVRSELPCHRPMFAGFALVSDPRDVFARYPGKQYNFSGDVMSNVGLYVTQTLVGSQLKFKRPPVYKAIDLEEIIDVLCQYFGQLLTRAANDPLNVNGQDQIQICPINYYQLRYLVRNDVYYMFNKTQPFVSRIYPQETSNIYFDYAALQAGIGTIATQSSSCQYPSFLIENIRCLTQRIFFNAKQGRENPVVYYPVVVESSGNRPSWKDYTYDIMQGDTITQTLNVFPDPGNWSNPSMLDGKLNNTYVSLVDVEALQLFSDELNRWISQYATYSCSLCPASIDAGVLSLITTSMPQTTQLQLTKKDSQKKLTAGQQARQKLVKTLAIPPPWEALAGLAVTSFSPILEAVVPMLNTFILPTAYIVVDNTDASTHLIQTEQGRTKEMSKITQLDQAGGGLTLTTIGRRHFLFASYMVKGRSATETNMDTVFRKAVESGWGGILSSLIGNVVKAIAPPEAHGIIDTIADFVPI